MTNRTVKQLLIHIGDTLKNDSSKNLAYVCHEQDNKCLEIETCRDENIVYQYIHVELPLIRVFLTSLLKQLDETFGNKTTLPNDEYEWMGGVIGLGFCNDTRKVHVNIDLQNVSERSLQDFLDTQITFQNVVQTFKNLNTEMTKYEDYQRIYDSE